MSSTVPLVKRSLVTSTLTWRPWFMNALSDTLITVKLVMNKLKEVQVSEQ